MKEKLPKLEYHLNEECLQALFQGKQVVFSHFKMPEIHLYPPRYGVFMTHEKAQELRREIMINVMTMDPIKFMEKWKELFNPEPEKIRK